MRKGKPEISLIMKHSYRQFNVAFLFLLHRETAGNKTKQMFSLVDILFCRGLYTYIFTYILFLINLSSISAVLPGAVPVTLGTAAVMCLCHRGESSV